MRHAWVLTAFLLVGAVGASPDPRTAKKTEPDNEDAVRIYKETCVVCHGEGVSGAPRPGVKSDWEPRMRYGVEDLYYSAMDGVGGQMPPRGMCMECSDNQLKAVVDFMVQDLK